MCFAELRNIVDIWKMIHGKEAINTAFVMEGGRITKRMYDTDSCVETLKSMLGLQVCQLLFEAVPSFYIWSIFYPENCNEYWFSTVSNAILYIIRMTYSWTAIVFVCVCTLYVCFICLTCCFRDTE